MAEKPSELIKYARRKTISTSKFSEAFRFVRERILNGASDHQILEEFTILHDSIPDVYCVQGGGTLTSPILKRFRAGIEAEQNLVTKRQEWSKVATDSAKEWQQNSPAFNLAKQRFAEGWSYDQIIEEMTALNDKHSNLYCSRQGKPITKAILCNWAKQMGYDTVNGNQSKIKQELWRQNSVGFKWFKQQILAGMPQETTIAEFNALHESNPADFSTPMGAGMTISTYNRWRREVLSSQNEKPIICR